MIRIQWLLRLILFTLTLGGKSSSFGAEASYCRSLFLQTALESKRDFSLLSQFFHLLQGSVYVNHMGQSSSKVVRTLKPLEMLYIPVRALLPFPAPERIGPTAPIFLKQWKDPHFELTEQELQILKRYNAEEAFEEKKQFLEKYPKSAQFRRLINQGYRLGLGLASVSGLIYLYHLAEHMITWEQYGESPIADGEDVQILIDVVPFPHLAIKIDHKVYSYGQTHLSVRPLSEYLLAHRHQTLNEIEEDQKKAQTYWEHTTQSAGHSLKVAFAPVIAKLGTLPRSIQVISLKLSKEEKSALRRDLESATAMRYNNETMVNDCGTMIVRALRRNTQIRVPRYLDAFPNTIGMYFALRKSFGDAEIGNLYQVAIDQTDRPSSHLVRNLYINILEAKIFLYLFPQNAYYREWMEIYNRDNPYFQNYDPETLEEIKRWVEDVHQIIDEDRQIKIFRQQTAKLRRSDDLDLKNEFIQTVREYVDEQKELISSSLSQENYDFKETILSEYRLNYYEEVFAEIQIQLNEKRE